MQNFNFCLSRHPLLSIDLLSGIDTAEKLLHLFEQPVLKEAIYLASPALYEELQKNKPDEKLIASLTKYLQRAATRCTPFALFASCSAAPISNREPGSVEPLQFTERRHTRLDMNYLCALAQQLAEHPQIRPYLVFYPNSSIYSVYDKVRYTEYRYEGSNRRHQLSNVDNNEYLQLILTEAQQGKTISELCTLIVSEEISEEEAIHFISELISAQLLVSNIEPSVTGSEFIDQLIPVLEKISDPGVNDITALLKETRAAIAAIDHSPLGIDINAYRSIGENLKQLNVEFDWKFLFQTDLFRQTNLEVDQYLADEVKKAIGVLHRLSLKVTESGNMKDFREAFFNKYEEKEVPLIEALDTENGLGFPYADVKQNDLSPMVDQVMIGVRYNDYIDLKWHPVHAMLFKKIMGAMTSGSTSINLEEEDIKDLKADENDLPDTFSAMISVTAYEPSTGKHTIDISGFGGSSAANLLGRFCHGDEKINAITREITAKEEALNPDIVFAEIVHLPESRIGNILLRPVLRQYEIPYLAKSGVADENRIDIHDLVLSVRSNKLVLRSKKLNKIVVPRMSTAHNFQLSSLPVYRFLCELQNHYHQSGIGMDLSFFESQLDFIPRITYQHFIFSPATWKFKKNQLEHLYKLQGEALSTAIARFRKEHRLPQQMILPDGDNELYLDWNNVLSVRCLFDTIKKRDEVKLAEFLFDPEKPYTGTKDGNFTNQFVFSFHRTKKTQLLTEKLNLVNKTEKEHQSQRYFSPGSEWLYFKVYTGAKTADKILTEKLLALTQQLKTEQQIDKYFFIRYADPKQHFRYRLQLSEHADRTDILRIVHRHLHEFTEAGLIANIQLDTYSREIERYGDRCIGITESLFETDSELCLRIVSYLEGDHGDDIRWRIGLLVVDAYLEAFGLSPAEKISFTEKYKTGFEGEFNIGKDHRVQIDKIYRENRPKITYTLGKQYNETDECEPLYALVNEYQPVFASLAHALYQAASREEVLNYLGSYIHMSVNRFFRSKQRLHEMMVYTYLNKHYTSEQARMKKSTTQAEMHV